MAKNPARQKRRAYINRELSWIDFDRRVLALAARDDVPLLERLKFLSIAAANLDEFFMVRVAGLKRQAAAGDQLACPSGLSPSAQLREIRVRVVELYRELYGCLLDRLLPALADQGIVLRACDELGPEQASFMRRQFEEEVFPLLTPVRLDPGGRLPELVNQRLHVAFLLKPEEGIEFLVPEAEAERIAVVQVPASLKRLVRLPEDDDTTGLALLEDSICQHGAALFPGWRVIEHAAFRIIRDADLAVDENADDGFVGAMEDVLRYRETGMAVRLTVAGSGKRLRGLLRDTLGLAEDDVYPLPRPLDASVFFEVAAVPGYDHLRYEAWPAVEPAAFPADRSVFDAIDRGDQLLFTPYESFAPVVRLVQEAADDPDTLSIKMTLYRTSGDSPIVAALERAARNGKHVSVLVEIKARFDEARNIGWAERLAKAGVIVVYGVARLKVHAKALLVIRRSETGIRRYLHLSTGNYNDRTARQYTDLSLFTARDELCYEAGLFFNAITGYSVIPVLKHLAMAPTRLKPLLLQLIERETQRSTPEVPGMIMAKLNALSDPEVIEALYRASRAGVRVRLNVRGICMLVPGVPGQSETIRVVSVIDRHLEHARLVWFANGGQEELYAASADWMNRNLQGRVELMFPILDPTLRAQAKAVLETCLSDTAFAQELGPDGVWKPCTPAPGEAPVRAQEQLYEAALERNRVDAGEDKRVFQVRRMVPGA